MPSSTSFLKSACEYFQLPFDFVDPYHMVMRIFFGNKPHVIINQSLGVNTDSEQRFMKDKFYSYLLLSKSVLMPLTMRYIDPDPGGKYINFAQLPTLDAIIDNIESKFIYPVVIKRNSGSMGKNVFVAHTRQDIFNSLENIYSKKQLEYDHVALAQQYIKPLVEYRVIVLQGKVEFIYPKNTKRTCIPPNLLHYPITDSHIFEKIQAFVDLVYSSFPITYSGLDIIEDTLGKLWLVEMNGDPSFTVYCRLSDNLDPIFTLHKKILIHLAHKYSFQLTTIENSVDCRIDYSHPKITMS